MGTKISQLPSATSVNDPDLIPIVQGGVTKKVTAAVLTGSIAAGAPGGTGTNLQYRASSTTFGGVAGSSFANGALDLDMPVSASMFSCSWAGFGPSNQTTDGTATAYLRFDGSQQPALFASFFDGTYNREIVHWGSTVLQFGDTNIISQLNGYQVTLYSAVGPTQIYGGGGLVLVVGSTSAYTENGAGFGVNGIPSSIGSDVLFFTSGSCGLTGSNADVSATRKAAVFGGDLMLSGTYAEQRPTQSPKAYYLQHNSQSVVSSVGPTVVYTIENIPSGAFAVEVLAAATHATPSRGAGSFKLSTAFVNDSGTVTQLGAIGGITTGTVGGSTANAWALACDAAGNRVRLLVSGSADTATWSWWLTAVGSSP